MHRLQKYTLMEGIFVGTYFCTSLHFAEFIFKNRDKLNLLQNKVLRIWMYSPIN